MQQTTNEPPFWFPYADSKIKKFFPPHLQIKYMINPLSLNAETCL